MGGFDEGEARYEMMFADNAEEFRANAMRALAEVDAEVLRVTQDVTALNALLGRSGAPAGAATAPRAANYGAGANEAKQMRDAQRRAEIALGTIGHALDEIAKTVNETIADGIAGGIVDGTYRWRDALRAVLKQIIAIIIRMQAQLALALAINAATGGGAMTFGGALKALAGGGMFHGGGLIGRAPTMHAGGLRPDERMIRAQAGEFVVRREAVRAVGVDTLERLNRTGEAASVTFAPNITIQGGDFDGRRVGRELGESMWDYFREQTKRGRRLEA